MRFESVAKVRVMGVDCIQVYISFLNDFSLILRLEYSVYSMFCFTIFCNFRLLVYSIF